MTSYPTNETAIIFKDMEHSQMNNLHGKYMALNHISNPFGTLNFWYHFLSHMLHRNVICRWVLPPLTPLSSLLQGQKPCVLAFASLTKLRALYSVLYAKWALINKMVFLTQVTLNNVSIKAYAKSLHATCLPIVCYMKISSESIKCYYTGGHLNNKRPKETSSTLELQMTECHPLLTVKPVLPDASPVLQGIYRSSTGRQEAGDSLSGTLEGQPHDWSGVGPWS